MTGEIGLNGVSTGHEKNLDCIIEVYRRGMRWVVSEKAHL